MKVEFRISKKKEFNVAKLMHDSFLFHVTPIHCEDSPIHYNGHDHVFKKQRSDLYKMLSSIVSPLHWKSHQIRSIPYFPQTVLNPILNFPQIIPELCQLPIKKTNFIETKLCQVNQAAKQGLVPFAQVIFFTKQQKSKVIFQYSTMIICQNNL